MICKSDLEMYNYQFIMKKTQIKNNNNNIYVSYFHQYDIYFA